MARILDFNSSGKTGAASTTTTFTSSDIPSSQVIAYHIAIDGVGGNGNTFNAISRIRVKANGVAIYDVPPSMFRAFISHGTCGDTHYPANQAISNLGVAGTAQDWRVFTIPFCFLGMGKNYDAADQCQFPVGANPTIEIQWNANFVGTTGSVFVGWTETTIQPRCWPKLYSQQMNLGTSQVNGRFVFSEDAIIRALGVNTLGMNRFRAVLDGKQVCHLKGQPLAAGSATVTEDMMFLEADRLWGGTTPALNAGTAAVDNSIVDPYWVSVHNPSAGTPGRTFVELQTASAVWAGVSNELGIYAVTPYERQG